MPSFTYTLNIPRGTDVPSVSQQQFYDNFNSINSLIGVDHNVFASPNGGYHNQSTYITQSPAPTVTAGNIALYNFTSPSTTNPELYYTAYDGTKRPFTVSKSLTPNAWTLLPSNVFLGYGSTPSTAVGANTLSWTALGMPSFVSIYTVLISTSAAPPALVQLTGYNVANLFVNASAIGVNFNFLVIGLVNSTLL